MRDEDRTYRDTDHCDGAGWTYLGRSPDLERDVLKCKGCGEVYSKPHYWTSTERAELHPSAADIVVALVLQLDGMELLTYYIAQDAVYKGTATPQQQKLIDLITGKEPEAHEAYRAALRKDIKIAA
jgi:hypothetical protein